MDYSTIGFPVITNSWNLLKLMSMESMMPLNHFFLCHPLLLLPSIFLSIRVFSNESVLHIRWPKYYSFSFRISPYKEYSRLISFRTDWLDLLAVQGTLKSLLQHHSSKVLILLCSAFFHPTPVLLPRKSHGRRSLEGCSPWCHWASGMPEQFHFHFSLSCIGEGNGNPLQCSCLENSMDRGAWQATVHGFAKSQAWLSNFHSLIQPSLWSNSHIHTWLLERS